MVSFVAISLEYMRLAPVLCRFQKLIQLEIYIFFPVLFPVLHKILFLVLGPTHFTVKRYMFLEFYLVPASDKEKTGKDIRTSEEETYSVQGRRNSGSSGSRPHKDKRSDRGGGLLPLAPFISLTFICPTLISLRFIPVTLF